MGRIAEAQSIVETYWESTIKGSPGNLEEDLFMLVAMDFLDTELVIDWLNGQSAIFPIHSIVLWKLYEKAPEDDKVLRAISDHFDSCLQAYRYCYEHQNPMDNGLIINNEDQNDSIDIVDPQFHGIFGWANECLLELGYALDLSSGDLFEQNEWTLHSFNELLWDEDEGIYHSYDTNAQSTIIDGSSNGFMPMLAGIPDINQAITMVKTAFSNRYRQEGFYSLPSMSFHSQGFDPIQPEHGAISTVGNWLMVQALSKYDFEDLMEVVCEDSLHLMDAFGFYSHYDPRKSSSTNGIGEQENPLASAIYLSLSQ